MKTHEKSGWTLIEMMISLSLFATFAISLFQVTQGSTEAVNTGAVVSQLQATGVKAMRRVSDRLQKTSDGRISPRLVEPFSASRIEYQQPIGFDGTDVVWGATESLEFELDPGEVEDGVDNDGDGIADEGRLVWTEDTADPNSRRISWVSNVSRYLEGETANNLDDNGNGLQDECGFSVTVLEETVTVHLSLVRMESSGVTHTYTHQTSFRLRN